MFISGYRSILFIHQLFLLLFVHHYVRKWLLYFDRDCACRPDIYMYLSPSLLILEKILILIQFIRPSLSLVNLI